MQVMEVHSVCGSLAGVMCLNGEVENNVEIHAPKVVHPSCEVISCRQHWTSFAQFLFPSLNQSAAVQYSSPLADMSGRASISCSWWVESLAVRRDLAGRPSVSLVQQLHSFECLARLCLSRRPYRLRMLAVEQSQLAFLRDKIDGIVDDVARFLIAAAGDVGV